MSSYTTYHDAMASPVDIDEPTAILRRRGPSRIATFTLTKTAVGARRKARTSYLLLGPGLIATTRPQ